MRAFQRRDAALLRLKAAAIDCRVWTKTAPKRDCLYPFSLPAEAPLKNFSLAFAESDRALTFARSANVIGKEIFTVKEFTVNRRPFLSWAG
jgi:hypothetical protein